MVLLLWGVLSDERTGLSFVYAAGPCQRSLSRVRVPWDSRPYLTVTDMRLPLSTPPTTRRVTVEVFDPASTRECSIVPQPTTLPPAPVIKINLREIGCEGGEVHGTGSGSCPVAAFSNTRVESLGSPSAASPGRLGGERRHCTKRTKHRRLSVASFRANLKYGNNAVAAASL
jgi:hypothetical protein